MTERVRKATPSLTPSVPANGNRSNGRPDNSVPDHEPAAVASAPASGPTSAEPVAASSALPSIGGATPPPVRITVQGTLYAALIVLAVLTRFWDLGSRTLHHDETLHTYYSWLYATGEGYFHNPLMHGPFLFHANAFIYWLFGDSDATSRIMPALFGVILVGLPYFLRGPRHLGQWGALIASTLLLLSPAILYQSRYIRHDIFTVVGSLVLFIGIVRYIERPQRRWLVSIGASLGFLLTNHEIVFGVAAIFGGVLWAALLWGPLRPLVPLHLLVIAIGGVLLLAPPGPLGRALPTIPWDRDGGDSPVPSRENQLRFYWELFTHPLAIAAALLATLALVAMLVILARRSAATDRRAMTVGAVALGLMPLLLWGAGVLLFDAEARTTISSLALTERLGIGRFVVGGVLLSAGIILGSFGIATMRRAVGGGATWVRSIVADAPDGSVAAAFLRAALDPVSLGLAIGAGAAIFVLLYSSLFTNPEGLFTGTVATDGTLLYWLGQHDFRRGEQPWFYYLLLMPQYELTAFLAGGVGAVVVGISALRTLARRATLGQRQFFQLFLAIWFVGIFAALSWAGEKMPWLIIHISLPATLLAAALLGRLVERWFTAPAAALSRTQSRNRFSPRWVVPVAVSTVVVAAIGWFLIAARLSYGSFIASSEIGGWSRSVTSAASDRWWWLAMPPLAALAIIGLVWIMSGRRAAARVWLSAALLLLALFQIHAGWRMSYAEGDVPKDMLIYTQTAPDVSRMVREIGLLSDEMTGGKEMPLWYGGDTSWPLQWYLRDFTNRELRSGPLAGPPDDVPVIIIDNGGRGSMEPYLGEYTAQEYVLRWWFPEYPIYRNFAIAPELSPNQSAWQVESNPHGPSAIVDSILSSLATQLTPEGQQRVYRLLMYRDLPERIDSFRYTVYVRNDLLPLLNTIRY